MKVCKYCGSENKDEDLNCSKCGANEFSCKCNNCDTVFDTSFCPNCGKRAGEKAKICPECGNKCFDLFCSKCGTDLTGNDGDVDNFGENIHNVVIDNTISNGIYKSSTTRTFTRKSGNTVTDTIINSVTNIDSTPRRVPPEVILQNYNYEMKAKKRSTVLKLVFSFILLIIVLTIMVSCIVHINGDKAAESSDESDKYANVGALEIVKAEGHPLFYGNFNDAKIFWKDYKKVKVVESGSNWMYTKAPLLINTKKEGKDAVITQILFDFIYEEDKEKLNIDEMLKIVCKYIPYDIISKYYSYSSSFKITDVNNTEEYVAYHYVMSLNINGKKLNNPDYDQIFAFDIICRNGAYWTAEISPYAANGITDKDGKVKYKTDEWKVDINKYRPEKDTIKTDTASKAGEAKASAANSTKQNKAATDSNSNNKVQQAKTSKK